MFTHYIHLFYSKMNGSLLLVVIVYVKMFSNQMIIMSTYIFFYFRLLPISLIADDEVLVILTCKTDVTMKDLLEMHFPLKINLPFVYLWFGRERDGDHQ